MKSQKAFTIIELIVVIVVLAILAVSIVPKLMGTSAYNARTTAAQYISHLRLVQLKAMNQRGVCHNSVFETVDSELVFGIPLNETVNCGTSTQSDSRITLGDSSITLVNGIDNSTIKASPQIVFDGDGVPGGTGDCNGACKIKVTAADSIYICIESQGYIHQVSSSYVCQ